LSPPPQKKKKFIFLSAIGCTARLPQRLWLRNRKRRCDGHGGSQCCRLSRQAEMSFFKKRQNSNWVFIIHLGGVGFDINCGVRLLRTNLSEEDVAPIKEQLTQVLFFFLSIFYFINKKYKKLAL